MTAASGHAAILATDVVGYSRLIGEDGEERPVRPASRVACARAVTCKSRMWRWAALMKPCPNIAAKGELLHVRTERGCRFIRLYGLN
jgi:hypothetical protein